MLVFKVYVGILIILSCSFSYSESNPRKLNAIFRPLDHVSSESIYNKYFANKDIEIRRLFVDIWPCNESFSTGNNPFSCFNTDFDNQGLETEKRRIFAERVLRLRIDSALRQYINSSIAPRELKNAHSILDNARNRTIKLSETPNSAVIKLGYDVINNTSKIEYINNRFLIGLYHSSFLGNLSNKNFAFLKISHQFLEYLGIATIVIPMSTNYLEFGISKKLSSSVEGRIITIQSLRNRSTQNHYIIGFTHQF